MLDWALSHPTRLIVITGGEPLLQQQRLAPLVTSLARAGRRIEIETNGTQTPHHQLLTATTQFNVSPKLRSFNGVDMEGVRINSQALRAFVSSRKSIFKFVVTTPDDIDKIAHWQDAFKLDPVWVMPAGTTIESVLAGTTWLVEHAIKRNWHVSTRLHILLWGDRRGR